MRLEKQNLEKNERHREIEFPDGTVICFNNDSKDELLLIYKKIHKYIDELNFSDLEKIKKYRVLSSQGPFGGACQIYVSDNNHEREKNAIDSLKRNINRNKFKLDEVSYENIVKEYFNNFLFEGNIEVNISDSEQSNDALIIDTNNHADETPEMEQRKKPIKAIPIFMKVAFPKGMSHILYADAGIGKSLMSIAIANSDEIKKPMFILVDNGGGGDAWRYHQALGDKAVIITWEMFNKKADDMEKEKRNIADRQIMMEYNLNAVYRQNLRNVENITNRVYARMGIKNKVDIIDNISVLVAIMEETVKPSSVDFICVDSINAVFGDVRRINRERIQRITKTAADAKTTLLCIHHTNKNKKEYAGSGAIGEAFDYVYRLSKCLSSITTSNNETILLLEEEKARYSKENTYRIKRTIIENNPPEYELLEQTEFYRENINQVKNLNLSQKIQDVLLTWQNDTITFDELKKQLGGNPPLAEGSIKNCLKKLETGGKVRKTNNHWYNIQIVK
jgi:hypothetical protein